MEAAWGHVATESARGTDTMPSPGHEGDLYLRGECPETHARPRRVDALQAGRMRKESAARSCRGPY